MEPSCCIKTHDDPSRPIIIFYHDPSCSVTIHHDHVPSGSIMIHHVRMVNRMMVCVHEQWWVHPGPIWSNVIIRDPPWSILFHHDPACSILTHLDTSWSSMAGWLVGWRRMCTSIHVGNRKNVQPLHGHNYSQIQSISRISTTKMIRNLWRFSLCHSHGLK